MYCSSYHSNFGVSGLLQQYRLLRNQVDVVRIVAQNRIPTPVSQHLQHPGFRYQTRTAEQAGYFKYIVPRTARTAAEHAKSFLVCLTIKIPWPSSWSSHTLSLLEACREDPTCKQWVVMAVPKPAPSHHQQQTMFLPVWLSFEQQPQATTMCILPLSLQPPPLSPGLSGQAQVSGSSSRSDEETHGCHCQRQASS